MIQSQTLKYVHAAVQVFKVNWLNDFLKNSGKHTLGANVNGPSMSQFMRKRQGTSGENLSLEASYLHKNVQGLIVHS